MASGTFIVAVEFTVRRLAVNADGPAGVLQCACKTVASCLGKACTAGIVLTVRMFAAYGDIAFATTLTFVIYAVVHCTL